MVGFNEGDEIGDFDVLGDGCCDEGFVEATVGLTVGLIKGVIGLSCGDAVSTLQVEQHSQNISEQSKYR